jgi:hypothetical protein
MEPETIILHNMNINKIKGHIYFIFGILFIFYMGCIRFFIERLPKDLTLPFNLFTIITFLWFTLFFYILFILNLRYSLIQIGILIMRPSVLQKLYLRLILPYLGKYTSILAKSLVTVHEVLTRYLNPNLLKNIGIFVMKHVSSKNTKYLVVLFDFLPKGLILFCLIIDVFIYKELSFIYKFGSFLLIPLLFRYILFAVCTDCLSNLEEGDNSVCIISTYTSERITSFDYLIEKLTLLDSFDKTKYHYIFTQEFLNETQKMTNINYTETLKQFMLTINLFVDIYIYIKQIQKWRENTILYFNLFLYLGYSITWTYIIFLVLST